MANHFEFVLNKARRIWGFVKRQSKEFVDPYVTKSLCCSLVRPYLEYCSTVWMPHSKCQGQQVDVIYTDFSKAFDRVNFCKLLKKFIEAGRSTETNTVIFVDFLIKLTIWKKDNKLTSSTQISARLSNGSIFVNCWKNLLKLVLLQN